MRRIMSADEYLENHPKVVVLIIFFIVFICISMTFIGWYEEQKNGYYEYLDFNGNKGISKSCITYDYKKYAMVCETDNGSQQVQAYKYIKYKGEE